jgi:diguanylate cyclase (GGDEF)-like protein
MRMDGREVLVGIGYLDHVGWYNITLMNVDEMIDHRLFGPIAVLLAVLLASAVALMMLLFKRSVLDRLARLETSIRRVEGGDLRVAEVDPGRDEIGRLSQAFARMAAAVADNTGLLESMVQERTAELRRLAHVDPLTGIYNRRGFLAAAERLRGTGASEPLGLLLIDMDLFKTINDAYGHHGGDHVLGEVARRLSGALRPGDVCARWGGDEFIVLVTQCDAAVMSDVVLEIFEAVSAAAIRLGDGSTVRMSVSIGGASLDPGEAIDCAVSKADAALYAAKKAGRDNVVLYDPRLHAPHAPMRRRA